jgi:hypothetical protein
MDVWYVEVKRAGAGGSEEISKVGYLHAPTRADLDELEGDGWEVGLIGTQSLAESTLGQPGSDATTIRAHAAVVAGFLERDMDAFLSLGQPPPSSALHEAEAVRAAAAEAGLTDLAMGLRLMIDQAREQIAEWQRGMN